MQPLQYRHWRLNMRRSAAPAETWTSKIPNMTERITKYRVYFPLCLGTLEVQKLWKSWKHLIPGQRVIAREAFGAGCFVALPGCILSSQRGTRHLKRRCLHCACLDTVDRIIPA